MTTKMGMIESLMYGVRLPWIAFRMISRSGVLIGWSLLPAGITLGLYGLGYSALQAWIAASVQALLASWGMDPTGWAAVFVLFIIQLTILVVGAVTFSIATTLIASPFNDFLAEATEPRCNPPLPPAPQHNWRWKLYLLRIDLIKSAISLFGLGVAVIASWIPGVNILGFMLAFSLVTFQYVSYAQTRRGMNLWQSVRFLIQNPLACISFGAVLSFLFAIPFVSCLALPLAVVGGTQLVARMGLPDRRA